MNHVEISIPVMSSAYKLYVYRAKSAESINTIAKVKDLNPVLVIDCASAETAFMENGIEYYKVADQPLNVEEPAVGIDYLGPVPNIVPTTEYETSIDIIKVNNYTYVNKLIINPLETKYQGTMLYYSVIGVDEANGLITHLSKVNGIVVNCPYEQEGTRHLYSCNDFQDEESDVWNYVGTVPWNKEVGIGDLSDQSAIDQYGYPFVETINMFTGEDVQYSIKTVLSGNYLTIEIPNPWQYNNKQYNYRKLKSYKLQNVYESEYSSFSEPTYQSLLPVSIEKMVILRKTDPEDQEALITENEILNDDVSLYQILRKDGVYYNSTEHRQLGLNKYMIPLEEDTGIFSESSVQDYINKQIQALSNHVYSFTIYLVDIYGNKSEPAQFVITT